MTKYYIVMSREPHGSWEYVSYLYNGFTGCIFEAWCGKKRHAKALKRTLEKKYPRREFRLERV